MDKNWKKALVTVNKKIEDVVAVINEACEYRVALVVDDNQKLLGTVTDGDIRRAIMRHVSLSEPVNTIMNVSPFVMHESEEKQKVRALLEREGILQVPIVNDENEVVGIETLHNVTKQEIHKNKVVIMAGGYGTRLRPLTDDCPKPMLSIGDKPLLEHIISDFMSYGFRKFELTVHYLPDQIRNYFGNGEQWGIEIQYYNEPTPLGTGGALSSIHARSSSDEPYIIINGDVLTKVHYTHLLRFHELHHADITVCVRKHQISIPYGVVQYDHHELIEIKEKPVINHFVNAGIYVINPCVFDQLTIQAPYHMTDLIREAKLLNMKVAVFPIHEYWMDIGKLENYNQAQLELVEAK
jgi:dTDP-glucose pyrophosphorylase